VGKGVVGNDAELADRGLGSGIVTVGFSIARRFSVLTVEAFESRRFSARTI
jgi:hypothetical protein